jgi:hypothetical protein
VSCQATCSGRTFGGPSNPRNEARALCSWVGFRPIETLPCPDALPRRRLWACKAYLTQLLCLGGVVGSGKANSRGERGVARAFNRRGGPVRGARGGVVACSIKCDAIRVIMGGDASYLTRPLIGSSACGVTSAYSSAFLTTAPFAGRARRSSVGRGGPRSGEAGPGLPGSGEADLGRDPRALL